MNGRGGPPDVMTATLDELVAASRILRKPCTPRVGR